MIDLDHFKPINDRYGHAFGDEVIYRSAQTVLAALAPGSAVGRLGGEEYLAVLVGPDMAANRAKADDILQQIKAQDFESSNASVQKLAKDYAAYKEWAGKGLVIMAKNFYALDDAFQATYILESVISSFPEFGDVVLEAQQELDKIKSEEAKTNSSINTDKN